MDKTRVRYSKTGKARYLAHLDLMTVMQRSFIRAGVNLKYSEGFNPHPYISVALPLSVGMESICELMDVAISGSTIPDNINWYLPDGLQIQKAYKPWQGFAEIKWVEIECCIIFHDSLSSEIINIIYERFTAQNLFINKKTKRGISVINIAPHIYDVSIIYSHELSGILITAKISAQNPTVSNKDIIEIINSIYADDNNYIPGFNNIEIKRIEIYDSNMLLFK